MSYGFKVYDASGNVRLNVTDRMTRVIYTQLLARSASGSVSPIGFDGTKGDAFAVKRETGAHRAPHRVTVSGNTVFYQPINAAADSQSASLLVVVHYK